MIYLASPYTHSDPAVQDERQRAVTAAAERMIAAGAVVFAPVMYTAPLSSMPPQGWYAWDLAILELCDELWVLMLDGWRESLGVRMEIDAAQRQHKPIRYVQPGEDKE